MNNGKPKPAAVAPFIQITVNPNQGTPENPNGLGVATNMPPLLAIQMLTDAMSLIIAPMAAKEVEKLQQGLSKAGLVMADGMTPALVDGVTVDETVNNAPEKPE